ncbi:TonB-dependent receptor domain-containing protein [Flavobacterium kingsejongi]|uniref:Outer membrane protein beta-barrel domain-containing protein n=1 Tax=Flavobacterium kingsejongi TaxID=1678728 RepID=A0A2S1LQF7_9FLAO|nr:TonB-dependent receptor [Flavobacterium kingsejongi]AWG25993.1 hypothetical protein FK004_12555 [Flavobacterium kingsejongi]
MRNKLLFCLSLFFTTSILSAQQYTVSGTITNQNNRPLEFVNAILLKNDTIAIQKTTADSLGVFSMIAEQGDYTLRLEQFGTLVLKREISLFQTTNLGNITVEESILLEGVTINAQKKLVEQKMDRLVYNVENSIASQAMNGLDAIRNTPLVRVQDDNISIVGKGGVSVMINDRIVNLSGNELTNYLQSLRSDDIARIEVITTPPSKYDAQGNSGIINIILKRNPNMGWSGNVSGTYQRNSYNGYRTGATLNYQSEKWSSSLKIRKYDLAYQLDGTRNLIGGQNSIYTTETRKDQASAFGLNYSLDYKINDHSNAGFIYDFSQGNYDINAEGSSRYEQQTQVDSTLNTRAVQHWKTPTHTFNAYYDVKLDTLGKKINFTGNYLSNAPDKNNDFNTDNTTTNNQAIVRNNSNMQYSIYSGQADLTIPYKFLTLETGAKYTFLDNTSNVGYYNYTGSNYILDPQNSNMFEYKEHNYAGYISLQKEFNEEWSAKAGLRYEYTALQGQAPGDENSNLKKEYGKLFPTAYVSYKPDEDHVFSLNYSRRINRPDFQSLNPFRWYTNPYMYYSGTPTLQPSYNNNVELSYSYKGKLTFGLYNQNSRNTTSSIARLEDGIYSNVIENAYNQNRTGE